ncbi:50S ribosomal protein L3 [Candidatus Aerophobetes bacterium]|nr:50S ribosomal protein L3 [Candidatus Aerophobetes bacterium]
MAKGHKPRAGSRAFWPKKRAKRIYPQIKNPPEEKTPKPLGFAGYKVGMTRAVFIDNRKESPTAGQEVVKPVTIIEVPNLVVVGIKVYELTTDGWKNIDTIMAEKLPKDLIRKTHIPKKPETKKKLEKTEKIVESGEEDKYEIRLLVQTKPRESGIGKKKPELFEIPLGGSLKEKWEYAKQKLGQEIKADEVFEVGEFVDVIAVTKGKGFQGPVKRFGVKIRPRKHEKKRRHVGNIGAVTPGRVLPGKIAMAGQLGYQTRTEYNKMIAKIGNDGLNIKGGWLHYGEVKGNYMVITGSVPGPKKRLIMLRKAVRAPKNGEKPELKEIFLESQQ